MRGKRAIALIICLLTVLALLPNTAMAANNTYMLNGENPTPTNGIQHFTGTLFEINGVVQVPINVINTPGPINNITNIQITGSASPVILSITYPTDDVTGDAKIAGGYVFVNANVNPNLAVGDYTAGFTIYANGEASPTKISFVIKKTTASASTTTPAPTEAPDAPAYPEGLTSVLMLAPLDVNGRVVPTPAGNYGDRVTIRVPIFNRGGTGARATRIIVTPVMSAEIDKFPFVIEAVDYSRGVEEMRPGDTREVAYDLLLSKEVTAGVKEVKFNAVYYNGQKSAYETATFAVYVNVLKGKTEPLKGAEGEEITTTPKVIIEGYGVKPAKEEDGDILYGGEQFDLTIKFRNTADEAVQNLQITMSNEAGQILPANNGSNTIYIDRMGAGDVVERTVQMLTVPEIEPKSHKISLKMNYESAKTLKAYEMPADISLSIKQRIRMRIDDPVFMEPEVMQGAVAYTYFNVYNMGISTVRNLLVSVEGEGLSLEEPYYGGNMSSGASTSVDIGIKTATVGEINGKIVITYEDAAGEVTRVEKPFTLNVMEMGGGMEGEMMVDPKTGRPIAAEDGMTVGMDGEMVIEGMAGAQRGGGLPQWIWILIGVAIVAAIVIAVVLLRKRSRRRAIQEK